VALDRPRHLVTPTASALPIVIPVREPQIAATEDLLLGVVMNNMDRSAGCVVVAQVVIKLEHDDPLPPGRRARLQPAWSSRGSERLARRDHRPDRSARPRARLLAAGR
jgi:hypothetical protein